MAYKRSPDKSMMDDPKEAGDDQEQSFQNASQVLSDICQYLEKKHFKLQPSLDGKHAGHDIYKRKKLDANPKIEHWALLQGELEWVEFQAHLENAIASLAHNGSDYLSVARKIQTNLTQQSTDKKSLTYGIGYAKAIYSQNHQSRSFTGQLAHKQIPRLSWFPELQSLDPYIILSLFPHAEAEALMLMLGRSMVGVGGTLTLEGRIEHKMRSAAIIVGLEAGLGKSSLLDGIMIAAKELGYTAEPIATANSRFGWGKIASSDIAFKDDLNKETQTAILKSETLKTIITGGSFSTERKGVDSETTQSQTTMICCSNDYNVYDFYKMDEGSISRFNFLYTYNQAELTKNYPDFDARTDKNVARLANQYNVSQNTIYTYLLAHSVERFIKALGIDIINNAIVKVGDDRLQEIMLELRNQFQFSSNIEHVRNLIESAAKFVSFSIGSVVKKPRREEYYKMLDTLGFDHPLLYITVCEYVHGGGDPSYKLKGMAPSCRAIIGKRLEDLSNRQGTRNAAAAFEFLSAELMSEHGASYPRSPGFYYRLWVEAKKAIPDLAEDYADRMWGDREDNIEFDELPQTVRINVGAMQELMRAAL